MSIIEHIILFLLLFGFYAIWGKYYANKSGVLFWQVAIIPILLYTAIVGSRYGWGADYLWYRVQYENPEAMESTQWAFLYLNKILNIFGVNYVGAFMIYSLIFIVCAFVFLRSYGETSVYMYAFLIPATLINITSFPRQALGISFIILALGFFNNRKWLLMAISVFIAYNFHSAVIFPLILILGIKFLFRKPIHYWFSIPLYILGTFVLDPYFVGTIMQSVMEFLGAHLGIGRLQQYLTYSDQYFGTDAIMSQYEQGKLMQILSSLFYIFIFYLGYRALKIRENKHVLYMYNTVVLGTILLRMMYLFELYRRIMDIMAMLYFIPLGYIFFVYFKDCKLPDRYAAFRLKKIFSVGMILIVLVFIYDWQKFLFFNPYADFFWHHLDDVIINTFNVLDYNPFVK